MRWLGLLTLLFAGGVGLLWAADVKTPDAPVKGFLVHEWGVWRVHDEVEFANADMRSQWDELPAFVYGQTTNRDFPHHWDLQPMIVTKPVIFFHAPQAMPVTLRVDFPTGVPAVWWPATWNPAFHQYVGREMTKPRPVAKSLEWRLQLQKALWASKPPSVLKLLNKPHWMTTLRNVNCDDVYVPVEELETGQEREKFVYYDGLLPRLKGLTIKVEKERTTLKNSERFPVFDVWAIDNRDRNQRRVGRLPRLDADASRAIEFCAVKDGRWYREAGKVLTAQLKAAGLNEDEAAALTTIFTDDFFHGDGMTVFYRLPQEEYDRLLPLTVKPQPEKIVRVGLVQQVPNDPELAARIARLVKLLDNDDFDKREAAQQELAELGRIAYGYLRRLKPTVRALEAKRRVEELLEKLDSQRTIRN